MNTFCNDVQDCPQLEKVGKEGAGARDCKRERKGEIETKLRSSCTDGKDGGLKPPKDDLVREMSL